MPTPTREIGADTPRPALSLAVGIPDPPRTERLTLRPLLESDRHAFLDVVNKNGPYLSRWLPMHEPGEHDDAYFERQLRFSTIGAERGSAWRSVAVLHDGTIAGCFNLNSISRGLAWEADAVWWIAESLSGRGLASEGLSAMLAHAMNPLPSGLGLHSVHCGVEPGNDASKRVAEKCGFRRAPAQQSYLKVGERWVMHDFYRASPDSIALCHTR
ncbi:MAG: GNAT family N-acetyltransferase [Phycisphaerales bacterium]|nr:GNAT family N-acetyltransferase [Phycisphaerales bacterium]